MPSSTRPASGFVRSPWRRGNSARPACPHRPPGKWAIVFRGLSCLAEARRLTGSKKQGVLAGPLRQTTKTDRLSHRVKSDHPRVYPHVRTVFEIGGESSKYIRLEGATIVDYDRSRKSPVAPSAAPTRRRP